MQAKPWMLAYGPNLASGQVAVLSSTVATMCLPACLPACLLTVAFDCAALLDAQLESEDYLPHSPTFYLERTKHWSDQLKEKLDRIYGSADSRAAAEPTSDGAATSTNLEEL
jgi:hypothetical protein